MLSKSASEFLKKYPPFSLLDDRSLNKLVERLRMELYPSGTNIVKQGETSSRCLYIIKDGNVRIFAARGQDSEEHSLDHRGVGETFGFLSLGESELLDISVQAVGDTICYVLDSPAVMELLEEHPSLKEYLIPSYFPKRGEMPARTPASQSGAHLGAEGVLFTTTVRDLACGDLITAGPGLSIVDASRLMSAHRTGALVILDEFERPVGIVTSSDLRDRVLARQMDPSSPVGGIMSRQLLTVEGGDYCFEALLMMMSQGVHHLLVMEGGRLTGIVSNHDFLILQGVSPLIIMKGIEDQATIEGLASTPGKVMGLISLLDRAGAGPGSILRIISTVNDRIERRVLDLALKTFGPPPVPFCWIVYGSAGRREQTFRTDQDNAIIYGDPADEREGLSSAEYFGRFAEFVVNAFLRCGFKLCPGEFMATTLQWRQPLKVWKKNFSSWISTPTSKAIHNSVNLFDFRGLHGEMRLSGELRKHLTDSLKDQPIFLRALADLTTDYRPPLGLFGSLVFEREGDHANHLNLKDKCLTPLINIVRLFSFESRIPETPTVERIAVLKNFHPVMKKIGDDLGQAFEFITLLRIRHQLEQASMNIEPDNYIDPGRLSSLELRNLREICRLISLAISDITMKYSTGMRL